MTSYFFHASTKESGNCDVINRDADYEVLGDGDSKNESTDNPEMVGRYGVRNSTIFLFSIGIVSLFVSVLPSVTGLDPDIGVYKLSVSAIAILLVQMLSSIVWTSLFHKFWFLKLALFSLTSCLIILSYDSFPYDMYVNVARIGAFIFIILQQVLLLDFAHSWSKSWVKSGVARVTVGIMEDTDCFRLYRSSQLMLLLATSIFYGIIFIACMVALFVSFGSSGCDSNIGIITVTSALMTCALILQLFGFNGSVLTSGIIAVYSAALTFSAVSLHPEAKCNPTLGNRSQWASVAVGMIMASLSILWNASVTSRSILNVLSDGSNIPQHALVSTVIGTHAKNAGNRRADFKRSLRWCIFCANVTFLLTVMYTSMILTNWGAQRNIEFVLQGSAISSHTITVDEEVSSPSPSSSSSSSFAYNDGMMINVQGGYVSMWMQACGAWISICMYMFSLLIPEFRFFPRSIWELHHLFS
eukprot:gene3224-6374_t